MIVVILFQKIIENKLKTPAQIFGEARERSYIYGVNGVRAQVLIKIKVMLKKIDFKYLVGAIGAFAVGLGTMHGVVQNYIHFAGIDNEMGFCVMSFMLGSFCLMGIKK